MAAQADVDWQQRALAAEAEVARLRKRNRELEDELDLLAVANADLRAMAAPAAPAPAPAGPPLESFAALRVHGASRALRSEPDSIDPPGQRHGERHMRRAAHVSDGLCAAALTVFYALHIDGVEPIQHACGSPLLRLAFSPVAETVWHADAWMAACGSCPGNLVSRTCTSTTAEAVAALEASKGLLRELGRWRPQVRIVAIWGEPLMAILRHVRARQDRHHLPRSVLKRSQAAHVGPTSEPREPLLLSRRQGADRLLPRRAVSSPHRLQPPGRGARISLNANDWDTHCSFAVLDMAVSPDGKYLACATDANKHIIYPLHGNEHVKVLVGHTADEYANARIAWLGGVGRFELAEGPGPVPVGHRLGQDSQAHRTRARQGRPRPRRRRRRNAGDVLLRQGAKCV